MNKPLKINSSYKIDYNIDVKFKPELVYINGDNRYVSAVEAIVAERAKNRQELLKNPEKYNQRIEELRKRIKVSGIKEQEERLDNLENAFNNELEKNRESRSF